MMELPIMSFQQYNEYSIKDKKLYSLLDLFDLDEYKEYKVTTTLGKLIDSVCPIEVRRTPDFFQRFVQSCGSLPTVEHYIESPESIASDLKLDPVSSINVTTWLSEPSTVLLLLNLFKLDNIDIEVQKAPTLEVPQFLKSQNIYLMGNFKNGSYEDIVSIFKSYGASITDKIDNRCTWVVLGSLGPMDDQIISLAQAYNIPIYDETQLFAAYQIDKDIAEAKSKA